MYVCMYILYAHLCTYGYRKLILTQAVPSQEVGLPFFAYVYLSKRSYAIEFWDNP